MVFAIHENVAVRYHGSYHILPPIWRSIRWGYTIFKSFSRYIKLNMLLALPSLMWIIFLMSWLMNFVSMFLSYIWTTNALDHCHRLGQTILKTMWSLLFSICPFMFFFIVFLSKIICKGQMAMHGLPFNLTYRYIEVPRLYVEAIILGTHRKNSFIFLNLWESTHPFGVYINSYSCRVEEIDRRHSIHETRQIISRQSHVRLIALHQDPMRG